MTKTIDITDLTITGGKMTLTESQIQALREQLDAPVTPERPFGMPEVGQIYYFPNGAGVIREPGWTDDPTDNKIWDIDNVFLTREAAERHVERRKALATINHYIRQRNHETGWVVDYGNKKQKKCYPFFNWRLSKFEYVWSEIYQVPLETEDTSMIICKEVIAKFPDELRIIFGVEDGKL